MSKYFILPKNHPEAAQAELTFTPEQERATLNPLKNLAALFTKVYPAIYQVAVDVANLQALPHGFRTLENQCTIVTERDAAFQCKELFIFYDFSLNTREAEIDRPVVDLEIIISGGGRKITRSPIDIRAIATPGENVNSLMMVPFAKNIPLKFEYMLHQRDYITFILRSKNILNAPGAALTLTRMVKFVLKGYHIDSEFLRFIKKVI
jgi:hypothetical protein